MLAPDVVKIDSALTTGIDHDPYPPCRGGCARRLHRAARGGCGRSRCHRRKEVDALLAVGVALGQSPLAIEAGFLAAIGPSRALNIRCRRANSSRNASTVPQPGEGT